MYERLLTLELNVVPAAGVMRRPVTVGAVTAIVLLPVSGAAGEITTVPLVATPVPVLQVRGLAGPVAVMAKFTTERVTTTLEGRAGRAVTGKVKVVWSAKLPQVLALAETSKVTADALAVPVVGLTASQVGLAFKGSTMKGVPFVLAEVTEIG